MSRNLMKLVYCDLQNSSFANYAEARTKLGILFANNFPSNLQTMRTNHNHCWAKCKVGRSVIEVKSNLVNASRNWLDSLMID